MKQFNLPEVIYIVKNCAATRTMYNEHEKYVAFAAVDDFEDDDPSDFGYNVVETITVNVGEGAFYPGTSEDWITSLEARALEAYKTGQTSIEV